MDAATDPATIFPQGRVTDLAHEPAFSIGGLDVDPAKRTIEQNGRTATLEPKAMKVLIALARDPDRVLSPDDLIEMCWDGRIVGDSAITRVLSLLRGGLQRVSEGGVQIENVRSVGYRLVVTADSSGASSPAKRPNWKILGLLLLALILVAVAWALFSQQVTPVQKSIVILSQAADNPTDELLAEGIASDISRSLQTSAGLVFRSPISAAALADEGLAPAEIGKRLGVDFVLTNSLKQQGDNYSLTYELHDVVQTTVAFSSEQHTSRSFLYLLPDQVASDVFDALGLAIPPSRPVPLENPMDAEVFFSASALLRSRDSTSIHTAVKMMRGFTEQHPDFAEGWSLLAKGLALTPAANLAERQDMTAEAREFAERARQLEPGSPEVLKVYGLVAESGADRLSALEKAVRLAPLDAEAWLWLANARMGQSQPGKDLEASQKVLELEPLWNRAWQATSIASSYGQIELANQLDDIVIAAANKHWQGEFAEARKAMRRGDLAASMRLAELAMLTADESAQNLVSHQLKLVPLLLQVPPFHDIREEGGSTYGRIMAGHIASEEALKDMGITPKSLWSLGPLLRPLLPLLIRANQGEFLVQAYDANFERPAAFHARMLARQNGKWWAGFSSAYLGWALRDAGRGKEATELFAMGIETVGGELAASEELVSQDSLIAMASLLAASGDASGAGQYMSNAAEMGWPYSYDGPLPAIAGPLTDDPLFTEMRQSSGFISELAQIRSHIAQERKAYLEMQRTSADTSVKS